MNIKTSAAPLNWGRHCLGIMRSLSPATLIAVTLALVVGGAGFADAATGGTFILGKANFEPRRQACPTPRAPRSNCPPPLASPRWRSAGMPWWRT
jgi:hypothetical protein